jgi:hypothetical protein
MALVLVVGLVSTALLTAAPAQDTTQGARYAAFAVNQNGQGSSAPVDITVTRWSTEAERTKLLNVLLEQGSRKLLDFFEGLPRLGAFAVTGNVGLDIRYAGRSPGPGGAELITLISNRPISFAESYYQSRSADYPFTVVQMNLPPNGDGEGTATIATKISMDRDTKTIVMENFETNPVKLLSIRRVP